MTPAEAFARWQNEESDMQGHLERLRDAAKGFVLEIGTRLGVSTSALLLGVEEKGGRVWSVDVDDCSGLFAGHPQWNFIRGDSTKDRFRILGALPPTLDLVLVDGDHSFFGCLNDLTEYGSRAKAILVHDTDCPQTWPGVRQAVDVYCERTGLTAEFFHESYGMALLR